MTSIVEETAALRAGLDASFRCRPITLKVHSSLEAVYLLATVTTRLAAADISVNAVSAFYHDHLFVAPERAEEACAILWDLMPAELLEPILPFRPSLDSLRDETVTALVRMHDISRCRLVRPHSRKSQPSRR